MSLEIIKECARNFGDSPRCFSLWDRLTYLRVPRPVWARQNPDHKLNSLFSNVAELFERGVVVWGKFIQANRMLFEPGKLDCPADILFSLKDLEKIELTDLKRIAFEVSSLKHTEPEDRELAAIARHLTDEHTPTFGKRVPLMLSPHFKCRMSTTFVVRKHLPGKYLCKGVVPLIVSPEQPHFALPLPSRYWPDCLVEWWLSDRPWQATDV